MKLKTLKFKMHGGRLADIIVIIASKEVKNSYDTAPYPDHHLVQKHLFMSLYFKLFQQYGIKLSIVIILYKLKFRSPMFIIINSVHSFPSTQWHQHSSTGIAIAHTQQRKATLCIAYGLLVQILHHLHSLQIPFDLYIHESTYQSNRKIQ